MTRKILVTLFFLVSAIAWAGDHEGDHDHGLPLKLGRYRGELMISGSPWKVRALLDIFKVQVAGEYPKLTAILKLNFGGYGSPEYLSYAYDKISVDPQKKRLSFEVGSEDVTLSDVMVHDGMLMGRFRSGKTGTAGNFNLYWMRSFESGQKPDSDEGDSLGQESFEKAIASSSYLRAVAGQYEGVCGNQVSVLQIDARRSKTESLISVNSYDQNHLTGRLGKVSPQDPSRTLVKEVNFHAGSYDFYQGKLTLFGIPEDLKCTLTPEGWDCDGGCSFKRTHGPETLFGDLSQVPYFERTHKLDRSQFDLLGDDPAVEDVEGIYLGYLHHEHLDVYQPVKFNVLAFRNSDIMHSPNQLYVSGVLAASVGESLSSEKLVYRFEQRPWLDSGGAMTLQGPSEGFGVVREWRNGFIAMDWYSKNFGRVGTIELVSSDLPVLPEGLKKMKAFDGEYLGENYFFKIMAGPAHGDADEPHNPFRPLAIHGFFQARYSGVTLKPRYVVEDGIYDFYTGAISILGRDENYITGKVEESGLKLFVPGANEFGNKLIPRGDAVYQRTAEGP